MLVHASTVAIDGKAVLLTGLPGAGKSDIALRLIDRGALLVADDQTALSVERSVLVASPPPSIEGLIELRHLGLHKMPFVTAIPVALYIDLVALDTSLERLPDEDFVFLLDQSVRRLRLPAFASSTPAKIRASLAYSKVQ